MARRYVFENRKNPGRAGEVLPLGAGSKYATTEYVDTKAAGYLPLTGGTMTGNITLVNGEHSAVLALSDAGVFTITVDDVQVFPEPVSPDPGITIDEG